MQQKESKKKKSTEEIKENTYTNTHQEQKGEITEQSNTLEEEAQKRTEI